MQRLPAGRQMHLQLFCKVQSSYLHTLGAHLMVMSSIVVYAQAGYNSFEHCSYVCNQSILAIEPTEGIALDNQAVPEQKGRAPPMMSHVPMTGHGISVSKYFTRCLPRSHSRKRAAPSGARFWRPDLQGPFRYIMKAGTQCMLMRQGHAHVPVRAPCSRAAIHASQLCILAAQTLSFRQLRC